MLNIKKIYQDSNAMLNGHFLLSSGNHSSIYLQSAKVLENPKTANLLAKELASKIKKANIKVDTICSPALGGIIAGYELANAFGIKFIFAERVNKKMTIRRGFEISKNEKVIICEDIITTGGSALEAAEQVISQGGEIVAFASLVNRGFCNNKLTKDTANCYKNKNSTCKLPDDIPLFSLDDFNFKIYKPDDCPMCKEGKTKAIKPGSRGN